VTREIVTMIRRRVQAPRSDLDANPNRLYLRNAVLEFKNGQVIQHSHRMEDRNIYAIMVDYDPARLEHPHWSSYLNRVLPASDERELLQEIFGYCLLKSLDYQCFFVFPGPPATGKSTTLDVLNYLIGGSFDADRQKVISPYVSGRALASLGEKFGTTGLEKCLVNISSESSYLTASAESALKKITGGDPINIEYKWKDSFTCSCAPWIIVATNDIPSFSDASDALNQRVIILPFTQQLDLAKAAPNVALAIFRAEGPAILNWSIAGLLRLMARKGIRRERFTRPISSVQAAEEHRKHSNPVAAWLDECCELDTKYAAVKHSAHREFLRYCRECSYPTNLPHRNFNHFIKAMNNELRRRRINVGDDDRIRVGDSRFRVFRGVWVVSQSTVSREGNLLLNEANGRYAAVK
jgi:putative DNA primase/helicase